MPKPEEPQPERGGTVVVGVDGSAASEAAVAFAYEEAAEICDCAVGTVKSRVSRARRALHAILDDGAYDRDGRSAGDAMQSILADAERLSTVR